MRGGHLTERSRVGRNDAVDCRVSAWVTAWVTAEGSSAKQCLPPRDTRATRFDDERPCASLATRTLCTTLEAVFLGEEASVVYHTAYCVGVQCELRMRLFGTPTDVLIDIRRDDDWGADYCVKSSRQLFCTDRWTRTDSQQHFMHGFVYESRHTAHG